MGLMNSNWLLQAVVRLVRWSATHESYCGPLLCAAYRGVWWTLVAFIVREPCHGLLFLMFLLHFQVWFIRCYHYYNQFLIFFILWFSLFIFFNPSLKLFLPEFFLKMISVPLYGKDKVCLFSTDSISQLSIIFGILLFLEPPIWIQFLFFNR